MIIATTGTTDRNSDFLVYHGPYGEIIPRMAACGYRAAEMHIADSADIDRRKLWDTLKAYDMRLTSIGTGSVYASRHYNLVDRNPAVRQAAIRHLEQHMVTAEPDRALVIVGLVVGKAEDCSGREEFFQNLEESLYRLDCLAQAHDVWLGLELTNRYERQWLTKIAQGVEYLKSHTWKRILLHLDTVHMNIEEADIGEAILGAKGYVGHVHIADNDRWYPGHAHYPFTETLRALKDIGYEGALALETNCLPSERVSAEKSLAYLKAALESVSVLVGVRGQK